MDARLTIRLKLDAIFDFGQEDMKGFTTTGHFDGTQSHPRGLCAKQVAFPLQS